MGPTWVLSAPDGPHVGPMNLPIREIKLFLYQSTGDECHLFARACTYHRKWHSDTAAPWVKRDKATKIRPPQVYRVATRNLDWMYILINSSFPGQNGRRFADDMFKRIFLNEKVRCLTKMSLKFGPKGPIDKKNHICGTRGRWVKLTSDKISSLIAFLIVAKSFWNFR